MKETYCCEYCGKPIVVSRYKKMNENPVHFKKNHYIIHKSCLKGYKKFDGLPVHVLDDFKNLCIVHVEWRV